MDHSVLSNMIIVYWNQICPWIKFRSFCWTTYLEVFEVWMTWSKSVSRLGPGEATENTESWRLVSLWIKSPDWNGDSGLSRLSSVAEISASMICPGVISMGMPRSGVGGRGGVLGLEIREVREERATGEVGKLTVTGKLLFKLKLKEKNNKCKCHKI